MHVNCKEVKAVYIIIFLESYLDALLTLPASNQKLTPAGPIADSSSVDEPQDGVPHHSYSGGSRL